MSITTSIGKAVQYPRRIPVEVYSAFHASLFRNGRGVDVPGRDWDNLVILDACRYDLFEVVNTIEGDLTPVRSRGTHTGEFMRRNFGDRSFPETVYVSGNPNPAEVGGAFRAIVPLWETAWDDELQTVPPEAVTAAAREANDSYPEKRLIVHFLQPHYPWIGPEGRKYMEEHGYRPQTQSENVWTRLRHGDVPKHVVWAVYKENLEVTLPHVESLVEELPGKTVITSDHGNAFGEWDVYGHPARTYIEALVKVPWLVARWEERKRISPGETTQTLSSLRETVDEGQLEALGYMG